MCSECCRAGAAGQLLLSVFLSRFMGNGSANFNEIWQYRAVLWSSIALENMGPRPLELEVGKPSKIGIQYTHFRELPSEDADFLSVTSSIQVFFRCFWFRP